MENTRATAFERHAQESVDVSAPPSEVFDLIDEHTRLSAHMNKSSWMMGGGKMNVEIDELRGKAVGSHIKLSGRAFGFSLYLDEVVTKHDPPFVKSWATVGAPRLLVIGAYQITVTLAPTGAGSQVTVAIDYDLPSRQRWLGVLFGRMYANWCVQRILADATAGFN
jgi:hypothetical protein